MLLRGTGCKAVNKTLNKSQNEKYNSYLVGCLPIQIWYVQYDIETTYGRRFSMWIVFVNLEEIKIFRIELSTYLETYDFKIQLDIGLTKISKFG